MWSRFRAAGPDGADQLHAARRDILADQGSAGSETLALRVSCDLSGTEGLRVVVGSAAEPEARALHFTPSDIARAASRDLSPLAMIACELALPWSSGTDPLVGVRESLRPELTPVSPGALDPVVTRLRRLLDAGTDVKLLGENNTHKTPRAARVAEMAERDGDVCLWMDIRDEESRPEALAWQLLTVEPEPQRKILVVVNQVQFDLTRSRKILECVQEIRTDFGLSLAVLATGQPAALTVLGDSLQSFDEVSVRAEVAADDDHARSALYWFACLRLFDIHPQESAVQEIPEHVLARLHGAGRIQRRIQRSTADTYYLSPDERPARLIHDYGAGELSPGELVWNYLKQVGETRGRVPLERLDLVGLPGPDDTAPQVKGSQYLAPAWDRLFKLGGALADQCDTDETWRDNVGAAVFAAEALAGFGQRHHREWFKVAEFIRARWRYGRTDLLPDAVLGQSGEMSDFEDIRKFMILEDRVVSGNFPMQRRLDAVHPLGNARFLAGMQGDVIDVDRFHRTWMLGVLLGFEGTALDRSRETIEALVGSATKARASDGSFYPRRVPWVTARVILGLCRVGLDRKKSEVVRRACDWLLTPISEGGPYGEWWKGGTGSWNRDEATTAMCVTALIRAGVKPEKSPQLQGALAWLNSRAGQWTRSYREIDLALVLEAVMLGADDWRPAYGRMLNLLHWANTEFERLRHAEPESRFVPEGELRAPFAAAQLATLVQVAVSREASAMLGVRSGRDPGGIPHPRREAFTTTPGPEVGVRPLPSVQMWREALETIEAKLRERRDSRTDALRKVRSSPAVRARLEETGHLLEECRTLEAQLSERTPPHVLDRIKQLRDEVLERSVFHSLTYQPTERDLR